MADSINRMFELIDDLSTLCDDGIPIFPGRCIVNINELRKIVDAFPDAISDEINDARVILKKKDEILQDAQLHADRIIQDAKAERSRLLNESSLINDMKEQAEKFRQDLYNECQQIKMSACNEAQEIRLTTKNEAIKMRDESQNYAQYILGNLEQLLNRLYQEVMNGQQKLQEMKQNDSMSQINDNK